MYKYRVAESVANGKTVYHGEFDNENDAKCCAKTLVAKTHNTCFIQRYNGEKWQEGSVMYLWMFEHVCFYNRW